MRFPAYGRVLLGLSAVLFGVIALMWHDANTWQTLVRIWTLPDGRLIGNILMTAQIIGGVLLLFSRLARCGAIVLIIVYALFSLACIPDIVAAPRAYEHYGSFFEQFALLNGALAIYGFGGIARIGMGLCAISFALAQIFYFKFTSSLVPAWMPPDGDFWTGFTTAAFALAALAILINVRARLALWLMSLMLVLFGLLVWVPLVSAHSQSHGNWSELALTFLIAGAAWSVADATAGWRSGRTA